MAHDLGCSQDLIVWLSTRATTLANSSASCLLSPSIANCSKHTHGVFHESGKDESIRRAKPPLGMKGTIVFVASSLPEGN